MILRLGLVFLVVIASLNTYSQSTRKIEDFNNNWTFSLGDIPAAIEADFDDSGWRKLNLPHDWSIEGEFSNDHPATVDGGALPGGAGWYRKSFTVPLSSKNRLVYIDFDGIYENSEVWINGHYLGLRPNGYIAFRYNLTPYLKYGNQKNLIAVKADNSKQPNSRWYSGSGIYRNVKLVTTGKVAVAQWGTKVTTPVADTNLAQVLVHSTVVNSTGKPQQGQLVTLIYDVGNVLVSSKTNSVSFNDSLNRFEQHLTVSMPKLWSTDKPYLYKVITRIKIGNTLTDEYQTPLGIRYFDFDAQKGFSLNGKPMKILGVCNHHDLGALGAVANRRAMQRQLEILKNMGCNGIRTSHNPPAEVLLELCDEMGFIVMDEAFDMWAKSKKKYDYAKNWTDWHKKDLEDQILRDRNHPSVFMWSIGNEISEQTDSSGAHIAKELAAIVKTLDAERPVTAANNRPEISNSIISSGALDLIGYNYHHEDYQNFHQRYPGKKFIAAETTSGLAMRGHYDMPSDSIRRWTEEKPHRKAVPMNPDFTVSAYDNVSVPWGSTHEETWKVIKKYNHLSGLYIWTGFDYLGGPTPYRWPARSSYFGIIDLAGFPKDVYYMYQSEWTSKDVLHIFPHWNWTPGKVVDVWAYYNNADEVELYMNGISQGIKKKSGDDLHVMWRLTYQPGTLKAVSRKSGQVVLEKQIKTAGVPAQIKLEADRNSISADGKDLSFITVKILDNQGNVVPDAENVITFKVDGNAFIAGVDNGNPISHEPFKASYRKAFHGLALAILQANTTKTDVKFTASADGLAAHTITLSIK